MTANRRRPTRSRAGLALLGAVRDALQTKDGKQLAIEIAADLRAAEAEAAADPMRRWAEKRIAELERKARRKAA